MRHIAILAPISAVALGLVACAAKTPKSSAKQELSVPPDAATVADIDHSAHAHAEPTISNVAPTAEVKPESSAEFIAFERAKPVFKKHCARCHTESSGKRTALKHFVMDTYPFGGHHASSMPATIRKVLGQSGKRATMPKDKPGVVSGEELELVLEWADATERAASTKPKPADGHDHKH